MRDAKSFPSSPFEQHGLLPDAIPPPFGTHGAIFFMESSNVKGTDNTKSRNISRSVFFLLSYFATLIVLFLVIEPQEKLTWDWRLGFRRAMQDVAKALELHIRHITG